MTYRAGLVGFGEGRPPTIFCDGCSNRIVIGDVDIAPAWFLQNKPKRGWSLQRTENADGSIARVDLCPACKKGGAK